MLGDTIRSLRKSRGITQEEFAQKVNVVRQTVSKWEKGFSVPDAETLQRIADVFDVSVSELLGAEIKEEKNRNEIAEQMARLNEQLAIKNRRARRIWRTVGITLLSILVIIIVLYVMNVASYKSVRESGTETIEASEIGD